MKKKKDAFLNVLLGFGLLLIFAGFLFFAGFAGGTDARISSAVYSVVICLCGFVCLYVYFSASNTPFWLFAGTALVLNGLFSLFVSRGLFGMTIGTLWPVFIILTGFSLFIAGRTKRGRRLVLPYDLPGIIFLVMGIIFLLFSLEKVTVPLAQIVLVSIPFVLICSGVILVVLFCKRKALLDLLPEDLSDELSGKRDEEETHDFYSGEVL